MVVIRCEFTVVGFPCRKKNVSLHAEGEAHRAVRLWPCSLASLWNTNESKWVLMNTISARPSSGS